MSSWQVGLVANTVIALSYFGIMGAIIVPLIKSKQVRANRLGTATALIFMSCAVHHGMHAALMLMPSLGVDVSEGMALRLAWGWPMALWDVVGAAVGVYYWSLRRTYGSLMQGAKLFEDLRQREQQALELNDNVLQGLVVAKLALDLDDTAKARHALDTAIGSVSHMVTDLLKSEQRPISAGLLRRTAAIITPAAPPEEAAAMAEASASAPPDGPGVAARTTTAAADAPTSAERTP